MDSREPRAECFVSHGHADHLGFHEHALCTEVTAAIAAHRVGLENATHLRFGEPFAFDADTKLTVHPAGHVLGSAMLHVERPEGSLLYTGDYKLRKSHTVETADPPRADVLLMESTYGKPEFVFPPAEQIEADLLTLVDKAFRENRQPIVYGYSLGKAQEAIHMLTRAGHMVTQHGAVATLSDLYEKFGQNVGPRRRYQREDFHGNKALDLRERGVLVAPPQAAKGAFTKSFKNPLRIMLSGWGLLPGATYRYQVDSVLPLSDHADFADLIETAERVQPKKIYTHHGFKEFPDELRKRGWDASLARPPQQMELFG
jgi:Cft2 family RNA processing exonuclease